MSENIMVPTENWLNATVNYTDTVTNGGDLQATGCVGQNTVWYQPYWWPYYQPATVTMPARPIKLALSEIEVLRKAAKADQKLKAILNKFTDQIEIAVDFS